MADASLPFKREEDEPWAEDEIEVRAAMLEQLSAEGWDTASLDPTLLLQVVRGHHYKEPRVQLTLQHYREILEWRKFVGADALLSQPPPQTVSDHAEWRALWHCDIYGQDSLGHPIFGHRLGAIDPVAFGKRFSAENLNMQYMRDLEFLQVRTPGAFS